MRRHWSLLAIDHRVAGLDDPNIFACSCLTALTSGILLCPLWGDDNDGHINFKAVETVKSKVGASSSSPFRGTQRQSASGSLSDCSKGECKPETGIVEYEQIQILATPFLVRPFYYRGHIRDEPHSIAGVRAPKYPYSLVILRRADILCGTQRSFTRVPLASYLIRDYLWRRDGILVLGLCRRNGCK
jgi:hypothetical protein